jgi:hypothetical protein
LTKQVNGTTLVRKIGKTNIVEMLDEEGAEDEERQIILPPTEGMIVAAPRIIEDRPETVLETTDNDPVVDEIVQGTRGKTPRGLDIDTTMMTIPRHHPHPTLDVRQRLDHLAVIPTKVGIIGWTTLAREVLDRPDIYERSIRTIVN